MNTSLKIKAEPSEETEKEDKEDKEVTDHPSKEEEEEEEKEDKDSPLNNKQQLFNQLPNNKLEIIVLCENYYLTPFLQF
jgi:hypothetical protein